MVVDFLTSAITVDCGVTLVLSLMGLLELWLGLFEGNIGTLADGSWASVPLAPGTGNSVGVGIMVDVVGSGTVLGDASDPAASGLSTGLQAKTVILMRQA